MELINRAGNEIRGHVLQQADERFARRLAETIAALETRLTERMAALETRVIRWTFVFWVGQLAPILAVLFVFFEP